MTTKSLRDAMVQLGWQSTDEIENISSTHASSLYVIKDKSVNSLRTNVVVDPELQKQFEQKLAQLGLKLDADN